MIKKNINVADNTKIIVVCLLAVVFVKVSFWVVVRNAFALCVSAILLLMRIWRQAVDSLLVVVLLLRGGPIVSWCTKCELE